MRSKLSFIFFILITGSFVLGQNGNGKGAQNPEISIYPNPAADYIIIEFDYTFHRASFELHSMIGNKIKITPEELSQGKFRISLKDFATGYYFLIVKDKSSLERTVVYKILKN